jgi:hypothetical protein
MTERMGSGPAASRKRLILVGLAIWMGYEAAQWPFMRALYSAEDKWAHGAAFCAVVWALRWATGWRPWLLAVVAAALGGAVEVHQMFLPGFSPSWADWAADLGGIALAMVVLAVWPASESQASQDP